MMAVAVVNILFLHNRKKVRVAVRFALWLAFPKSQLLLHFCVVSGNCAQAAIFLTIFLFSLLTIGLAL